MSARWRAPARPPAMEPRVPALALLSLLPLLAAVLLHTASAADAPSGARRLDPDQARREGVALELVPRLEAVAAMLEVRPVDAGMGIPRVLDVARQAGTAAVATGIGREIGVLTLAHADGSQLQVPVEGLLDAAFAPDDTWLAVVDGSGRLWTLGLDDGALRPVSDGPFLQAPLVEDDGSILALAVSSVEAPFRSHLVRVGPTGAVERLSAEELVYDAQLLADGSLAVIAHRPGGTVVRRIARGSEATVMDLGADAVNVSLSTDGGIVAWETAGETFLRMAGQAQRSLGRGSSPVVSPDGRGVLLTRDGGRVLVDPEGTELAALPAATTLLECGECGS